MTTSEKRGKRYTRAEKDALYEAVPKYCAAEWKRVSGNKWPDREITDVMGHPVAHRIRDLELQRRDRALLGLSSRFLRRETLIDVEHRGGGGVVRPKPGKEKRLRAVRHDVDAARAREALRKKHGSLRLSGLQRLVRLFHEGWLPVIVDRPRRPGDLLSVDHQLAWISILVHGVGEITNWKRERVSRHAVVEGLTVAEVIEREANAIRMERKRQEKIAAQLRAKRKKSV